MILRQVTSAPKSAPGHAAAQLDAGLATNFRRSIRAMGEKAKELPKSEEESDDDETWAEDHDGVKVAPPDSRSKTMGAPLKYLRHLQRRAGPNEADNVWKRHWNAFDVSMQSLGAIPELLQDNNETQ